MKNKFALPLLLLGFAARLAAETLSTDAVVFLQPDPGSPVLTRLKAGTAITAVGEAPAGWKRVEVTGTFEAFAHSRDVTKNLEIREGANLLATPKKDSATLTVVQKGDKTEVSGMVRGTDYCQVRLEKKLQGFVALGAAANRPAETRPSVLPPASSSPSVSVNPPPASSASPSTAPGRPVAVTGNTADLARVFSGTLVLARRPIINPNPPYEYQLTDSNGRRFAYVDTKRLVLTERLDTFLDRVVNVTGAVRNTVDGKDLVVSAESMHLKR